MQRYEISDDDWYRLAPLLPGKSTDVGRTASDNRTFINAVLWIARSDRRPVVHHGGTCMSVTADGIQCISASAAGLGAPAKKSVWQRLPRNESLNSYKNWTWIGYYWTLPSCEPIAISMV